MSGRSGSRAEAAGDQRRCAPGRRGPSPLTAARRAGLAISSCEGGRLGHHRAARAGRQGAAETSARMAPQVGAPLDVERRGARSTAPAPRPGWLLAAGAQDVEAAVAGDDEEPRPTWRSRSPSPDAGVTREEGVPERRPRRPGASRACASKARERAVPARSEDHFEGGINPPVRAPPTARHGGTRGRRGCRTQVTVLTQQTPNPPPRVQKPRAVPVESRSRCGAPTEARSRSGAPDRLHRVRLGIADRSCWSTGCC